MQNSTKLELNIKREKKQLNDNENHCVYETTETKLMTLKTEYIEKLEINHFDTVILKLICISILMLN